MFAGLFLVLYVLYLYALIQMFDPFSELDSREDLRVDLVSSESALYWNLLHETEGCVYFTCFFHGRARARVCVCVCVCVWVWLFCVGRGNLLDASRRHERLFQYPFHLLFG